MSPFSAARLIALAALVAGGCAAFDPYNVLTRQWPPGPVVAGPVPEPPTAPLGEAGRLAAFDFVWRTVNERYYDPKLNGVDWAAVGARWKPQLLAAESDDEFWDKLDRMAGELNDAHTRVESPKRAELIARFENVSLGFSFRPLEGRLVVTGVNPESEAWWAGVRPGMSLDRVGDETAQAAYGKLLAETRGSSSAHARHVSATRRLLAGEPDSSAILTFARGDGSPFTVSLKRTKLASTPRVSSRTLPSGFGYIRLTAWSQPLEGRMVEAVESLKDRPGLIFDLRGNPGGSALMVRNVARRLFTGKVEVGRTLTRTGEPVHVAFGLVELIRLRQEMEGTGTYSGPVVVLVNADSGSASELFAGILQSQGRARILGDTTCGCLLAYLGYAAIPGGGKLAYSEVGFLLPDGKRIEHEGVQPDRRVPLAVADLLVDRDRALEAAQAELKAMGPWKGSNKVAGP